LDNIYVKYAGIKIFARSCPIALFVAMACSIAYAQQQVTVTPRPEAAMNSNAWRSVSECGLTVSMPGIPQRTVKPLKTVAGIDNLISLTVDRSSDGFMMSCQQLRNWNPGSRPVDTQVSEFSKRGKTTSERSITLQGYPVREITVLGSDGLTYFYRSYNVAPFVVQMLFAIRGTQSSSIEGDKFMNSLTVDEAFVHKMAD
jgi:hypothetical protein